jgi:hypothetical protein
MLYFQLYSHNLLNELSEHLGSDGVVPMDGRSSVRTALLWAENNTFRDDILGYQLRLTPDNRYSGYTDISPIFLIRDI